MNQQTLLILPMNRTGHLLAVGTLAVWLGLSGVSVGEESDSSLSRSRWVDLAGHAAEVNRELTLRVADRDSTADEAGDIDDSPAEVYIRSTPILVSELEYSMPGEFERQSGLLISAGSLAISAPEVLVAVAQAATSRVPLLLLVNDDAEFEMITKLFARHGVGPRVSFLRVPHDTMWVRDYGPVVLASHPSPLVVDAAYTDHNRTSDDAVPAVIAGLADTPMRQTSLNIPGGNLLSNGRGVCITTTRVQEENPGFTQASIASHIADAFGATTVALLRPLHGESTGHVDMFATFTDAETVVVGKYDPLVDAENALILDQNAAMLASIEVEGQKLRVVRIPMPARKDTFWPTFTNVVYANGRLLVPVYETTTPHQLRLVRDLYASLLPGWEIHFIRADDLICHGGALHCVVANLGTLPTPRAGDSDPAPPHPLFHRPRLASLAW